MVVGEKQDTQIIYTMYDALLLVAMDKDTTQPISCLAMKQDGWVGLAFTDPKYRDSIEIWDNILLMMKNVVRGSYLMPGVKELTCYSSVDNLEGAGMVKKFCERNNFSWEVVEKDDKEWIKGTIKIDSIK